ncbi:MAG: 4Fe-4S dicluster domain-containing protein [Candidatus Magnetoovum sp. WYHC-5]|nr:4Fe-4S dicluster domain-containing protein [Candidatus Magnetoovum sp. WYHC-5]
MDGFWPTFTKRTLRPANYMQEIAAMHTEGIETPEKVVLFLQDFCQDFCVKSNDIYEVYVKEGERVLTGQKIGLLLSDSKKLAVHSSISGEVITLGEALHPLGWKAYAITIKSDGKDERAQLRPFEGSGLTSSKEDLLHFLSDMGILIDYGLPEQVSTLLINVTEFEPCFSSKERLVVEEQEKLAKGLEVFLKLFDSAINTIFLLEKRHQHLFSNLRQICSVIKNTDVQVVRRPYPVTLQSLLRERITDGKKTAMIKWPNAVMPNAVMPNAVMIEPSVLVSIYDAYYKGEPFIRQLISVVGSAVKKPLNLWIRCGTTVDYIVDRCGGKTTNVKRLTMGGPLMGVPQHTVDVPVLKRANGISIDVAVLFDDERKSRVYKPTQCIRCGKCVDVCPAKITPNAIVDLIQDRRYEEAIRLGLFSCLECGLCYYVCPSILPLMELMKMGKYRAVGKHTLLTYNYYKML